MTKKKERELYKRQAGLILQVYTKHNRKQCGINVNDRGRQQQTGMDQSNQWEHDFEAKQSACKGKEHFWRQRWALLAEVKI